MPDNLKEQTAVIEEHLQQWFEEITAQIEVDSLIWQFYLTDEKICLASLSPQEQELFKSFGSERKKVEWLIGRKALSKLISEEERVNIKFPNKNTSLSHSGNLAIAFRASCFQGVGADLQEKKVLKRNIAEKILQSDERVYLDDFHVLQLWSIKEALFKANPENKGTVLREYLITKFENNNSGSGRWGQTQFHFTSFDVLDYFIAFAVCIG